MKKILLTLLIAAGFSYNASASDLFTHTTAEPEHSFQLAATWFLPGWQEQYP